MANVKWQMLNGKCQMANGKYQISSIIYQMEDVKWNKLASNILHFTFNIPQDLFRRNCST